MSKTIEPGVFLDFLMQNVAIVPLVFGVCAHSNTFLILKPDIYLSIAL